VAVATDASQPIKDDAQPAPGGELVVPLAVVAEPEVAATAQVVGDGGGVVGPRSADGVPVLPLSKDASLPPAQSPPAHAADEGDSGAGADGGPAVVHAAAQPGAATSGGRVLGEQYLLVDKIGDGTFGAVWRALDMHTNGPVAVKIVTTAPAHLNNPLAGEMTEGEVILQLQRHGPQRSHPSLVKFLDGDVGVHPWRETLVFEWCPQGDLFDAVKAGLGTDQTKGIVTQIVDGVAFIHESGFVHCDLKLENVLLDNDRAVICDFGLTGRCGQARNGPAMGTRGYMAPELIGVHTDEQFVLDPTSDVWSLGILFHVLMLAALPWSEATVHDPAYVDFVTDEEVHLHTPWTGIPDRLRTCVISMLERSDLRPSIDHIAAVTHGPWCDDDDGGLRSLSEPLETDETDDEGDESGCDSAQSVDAIGGRYSARSDEAKSFDSAPIHRRHSHA
jgi:serine/threonine protein kinase